MEGFGILILALFSSLVLEWFYFFYKQSFWSLKFNILCSTQNVDMIKFGVHSTYVKMILNESSVPPLTDGPLRQVVSLDRSFP